MKKYTATYERLMPHGQTSVHVEHVIQASSLKHAKKLAKERLNKFSIGSMKLVDVVKASD